MWFRLVYRRSVNVVRNDKVTANGALRGGVDQSLLLRLLLGMT